VAIQCKLCLAAKGVLGGVVKCEGQRAPSQFSDGGRWRASNRCAAGSAFGRRQGVVGAYVSHSIFHADSLGAGRRVQTLVPCLDRERRLLLGMVLSQVAQHKLRLARLLYHTSSVIVLPSAASRLSCTCI
jgi:hypothetical protein